MPDEERLSLALSNGHDRLSADLVIDRVPPRRRHFPQRLIRRAHRSESTTGSGRGRTRASTGSCVASNTCAAVPRQDIDLCAESVGAA